MTSVKHSLKFGSPQDLCLGEGGGGGFVVMLWGENHRFRSHLGVQNNTAMPTKGFSCESIFPG